MHNSKCIDGLTYKVTGKGKATRQLILNVLTFHSELSRDEICRLTGLSYEQVRNQTSNLCVEGSVSSKEINRKRYYSLSRVGVG